MVCRNNRASANQITKLLVLKTKIALLSISGSKVNSNGKDTLAAGKRNTWDGFWRR